MKILYVITKSNEIGGAQVHLRDLAERLQMDNHEVIVVAGEYGTLIEQLTVRNIATEVLPTLVRNITPLKDLNACMQLRSIIKKYNPDIIGLHSSKAGIVGRIAAMGLKIPVIFTAHGWSFTDGVKEKKRNLYICIEKIMANFSDKIITVSEKDKELALKYKVASEKKQVVIHNGVIDFYGKIGKCNRIKIDTGKILITSVARFSEQKDHQTLICALSELPNTNWELHLIGKGETQKNIELLVEKYNLSDKVVFHGERDDVPNFLLKSDIFVLSSNWEGLPLSIIEAMSASLPVIATNVGGVSELITKDVGFLVPSKDINALKIALSKLINDENMRGMMGVQGRETYLSKFSFEAMYRKTLSEYLKLL